MDEKAPQPEIKKGIEAGTVFQVTLGHWHMGVWTSAEEAEAYIKTFSPSAKPVKGIPSDVAELPEGQYFIQPRVLFTSDKARAAVLAEQLGKK